VIATRDRRVELLNTLDRLAELPERPPVIVVDNGSRDGAVAAARRHAVGVTVIELDENRGAAARNVGVTAARTEYVAFSDDDSWWEPGALATAERLLDGHPRLAVVAARVLVGPERRLDPTSAAMAASPLNRDGDLPGPRVLGFVACGAVVRRSAFLAVGGFEPRLGIGGEEELLALDLAARSDGLAYVEDVVAVHEPADGARPGRRRDMLRNGLLVTWLRRPGADALHRSVGLLARHGDRGQAIRAMLDALGAGGWVLRERRRVPRWLASELRVLDRLQHEDVRSPARPDRHSRSSS
jgi:GT2 family glycosyltransferase